MMSNQIKKCKNCRHFSQDNLEEYGNGYCHKTQQPKISDEYCVRYKSNDKTFVEKIFSFFLKK